MVSTKYNRTGACLLILALSAWATAGCTDATSDSSVASLPAESSASSSEPAGDSSSPSDNSEKDSSGKPKKLETIDDPCADECVKGGSIDVYHPVYGGMTVVPYWKKQSDDQESPRGSAAYALYQKGKSVGYVEDTDRQLLWFGTRPVGEPNLDTWNLENNSNVDKYGNVYLSYNGGVTVLTPTDQGYNSYESLPSEPNAFENASLKIDPSGEPTLTFDEDGISKDHHWDGNQFVETRGEQHPE